MALRNQPYFPFYVNDFMTDEKLIYCSAASTGIYIRLMCIMHKSEEYGKICFNKNDKRSSDKIADFSLKLSKQMPYSSDEIYAGLSELFEQKIINFSGEKLIQKRMVKDNDLSEKRAKSGKKGMINRYKSDNNKKDICYNKNDNKSLTNTLTNTEYENEYENEIIEEEKRDKDIGGMGEKEKEKKEEEFEVVVVEEFCFEEIWDMYDKKTSRSKCEKKWKKLTKDKKEKIFIHVPKYVISTPNKQYRLNFETYLNQEAWNDEIILPQQSLSKFQQDAIKYHEVTKNLNKKYGKPNS